MELPRQKRSLRSATSPRRARGPCTSPASSCKWGTEVHAWRLALEGAQGAPCAEPCGSPWPRLAPREAPAAPRLVGRSGDALTRDFCGQKGKSSPAHAHVSVCLPAIEHPAPPCCLPGPGECSPSPGRSSYRGAQKVGVKPFCSLVPFSKQLSQTPLYKPISTLEEAENFKA